MFAQQSHGYSNTVNKPFAKQFTSCNTELMITDDDCNDPLLELPPYRGGGFVCSEDTGSCGLERSAPGRVSHDHLVPVDEPDKGQFRKPLSSQLFL